MAANLPENRPCNLDEFLQFTAWEMESPACRPAMQTALDYFQEVVPQIVLRRRNINPTYWAIPKGNVLQLCEWMQSIRFTHPVRRDWLKPGDRFKRFYTKNADEEQNPTGHFFALLPAVQSNLGLPPTQNNPREFVVIRPVAALISTVSDAATWLQTTSEDTADHFFRGNETQYFVWHSTEGFQRAAQTAATLK